MKPKKKEKKKVDIITITFVAIIMLFVGIAIFAGLDKPEKEKDIVFDSTKQPFLGDADSPTEVVLFGDYACGHCKDWDNNVFPALKKNYMDTNKIKFTFINFQFLGASSFYAGNSAEYVYANHPDDFWAFHRGLYAISPSLTEENVIALAKETVKNLDVDAFKKNLKEQNYLPQIKSDNKEATEKWGVNSTPSIFVNKQQVKNPFNYEEIVQLIMDVQ